MNRTALFSGLFLLCSLPGLLFGQSGGGSAAEEALDWMLQETTEMVVRELNNRGDVELEIGRVLLDGRPVGLGEYLAAALPIRLSSRGGHRISVAAQPGSADYRLEGKVFALGDRVQLFLSILNDEGKVEGGKELRLPDSSALEELLQPVSSVAGDLYEPDSQDAPVALIPGELIGERSLEPAGDTDWYRVDYREGTESAVLTVATAGSLDTYIEVYHEDNPFASIAENDDAEDANARVSVGIEPGEVLIIAVRGYDPGETGPYQLVSSLEALPEDASEPDNRREQAGVLSLNAPPLERQIYPTGDVDWYRIDLDRGGIEEDAYLDLRTGGMLDTYAELYDAEGNLLVENDDGGGESNARILYGPVSAGASYYLVVSHYDDSDIGAYTLTASISRPEHDRYEPDNDWESAKEVQLPASGQSYSESRTFSIPGDSDWIRFRISRPTTVEMATEGDIDTMLAFYDDDGELLDESDDDGDDYNGRIKRFLAPGVYRLEVRQYEEDARIGAEYRLTFTVD